MIFLSQKPTVDELARFLPVSDCKSLFASSTHFALHFNDIEFLARATGYDMLFACRHNLLNVMKWLHANTTQNVKYLLNYASACGHLDTVQWLHEQHVAAFGRDVRIVDALQWAAQRGHLSVVQFLYENNCSSHRAMDWAAAYGHLDVVQYLDRVHKVVKGETDSSEICTCEAMNWAAAKGHLSVVQWLHENRSEGCTTNAMDRAIDNGQLHVVWWLYRNRTEGCTRYVDAYTAAHGYPVRSAMRRLMWTLCGK